MESYKKKCKLCDVKISGTNFELIEAAVKDVLDVLFLKMKFDDEMQYLMCSICSVKLYAAFDFKSVCLHTDNTILSYFNFEEPSPVDLKDIYVKEKGISILDDEQICRLCMHPINGVYISAEKVHPSTTHMYIPEINFKATVDPILCKMCYDALFMHSSFLKSCLNVEQRTQINISPVMDTHLSDFYIKTEEIEIKDEEEIEEDQEMFSGTQFNEIQLEEEIRQESDQSLLVFCNGTNVDDIELLQQPKKSLCKRKGDEPSLEAYNKHTLEIKGNENNISVKYQRRKDPSEMKTYKYRECKFETAITQGSRIQKLRYKYTSEKQIYKYFKIHQVILKRPSEVETRYKNALVRHQLNHKDPSEVKMHKCSECKYETKYKHYLKTHQLKHKDPSEMQMYKCSECKYETKIKSDLKLHQLRHKDPSELQMYKCNKCQYETKYKDVLAKHQVRHKDPSEVELFMCLECKFVTKHKRYLKIHQLRHKDPSEVQMYKCSECKYESKFKRYFKEHQLRHKDPSEVQMYKCSECIYETKFKKDLKRHLLRYCRIMS